MSPENAHRLARAIVYGALGGGLTAASPVLTGILRGLVFGLLFVVVVVALVVVATAQLIHDGIVDMVGAL